MYVKYCINLCHKHSTI